MLLIAMLLAACTTKTAKNDNDQDDFTILQIAGVEIYNGLSYSIQDVIIKVPVSGDFVSCGEVLPASSCATSFPLREYQGNKVQVSWKENGQEFSTAEFRLTPPDSAIAGQEAYIRVEVFAEGQAGAKLVLLQAVED